MPTKSGDSKSSEGKASPRSVLSDRKLDRFAKPASISYTRDGRPFVGLPDEPSIEVRRHAVEAKWANTPHRTSRKMEVKPTAFSRPQGGVRKLRRSVSNPTYLTSIDNMIVPRTRDAIQRRSAAFAWELFSATETFSIPKKTDSIQDSSQSRRYAARGQFEAAILAQRESEDLGSSKFLAQRAACIHMDKVRREESKLLSQFPHGAPKQMIHKHSIAHNTDLPGLGYDQKSQALGRS